MFKKLALSALTALGLSTGAAMAAGDAGHIENFAFSFEGPFGTYDQMQLQRGLKVYTEACSACHGMKYVPLRDLSALGYSEEEVIAYSELYEVFDPTLADGDGDFRAAKPTDHFPAVTSAGAPDLSMMAKARAGFHGPYGLGLNQLFKGMGGAEYIASILVGYTGEEKTEAGATLYENTAFPGGWISMAPPLVGEDVEYADGHSNELHHVAEDLAAFLMWTAEPKMMARKHAGLTGVIFLTLLSVLLYLTNKRLWAPVKGKGPKAS